MEVLEAIDFGIPQDAEDDDERSAIGRILAGAGKVLLRRSESDEPQQRFVQAESFFAAVAKRSCFISTHHADVLLRLNRGSEAAEILDQVPLAKREGFWLLYRRDLQRRLSNIVNSAIE